MESVILNTPQGVGNQHLAAVSPLQAMSTCLQIQSQTFLTQAVRMSSMMLMNSTRAVLPQSDVWSKWLTVCSVCWMQFVPTRAWLVCLQKLVKKGGGGKKATLCNRVRLPLPSAPDWCLWGRQSALLLPIPSDICWLLHNPNLGSSQLRAIIWNRGAFHVHLLQPLINGQFPHTFAERRFLKLAPFPQNLYLLFFFLLIGKLILREAPHSKEGLVSCFLPSCVIWDCRLSHSFSYNPFWAFCQLACTMYINVCHCTYIDVYH